MYYTFLEGYSAATAAVCSMVVLCLHLWGRLSRPMLVAGALLVAGVLMAAEFYPVQLFIFPLNVVFPLTLSILPFLRATSPQAHAVRYILFGIHGAMMVVGLGLLSTKANTWGDGGAVYGIFIVPQSILILLLLMVQAEKRRYVFIGAAKVCIALLGLGFMYWWTSGFSPGDYDGPSVVLRWTQGILCCVVSLVEGVMLVWAYRRRNAAATPRD